MAVGLTLMAMDVLGLFPGSVLVHNAVVSVMNDAVMPVRLQIRSGFVRFTRTASALSAFSPSCARPLPPLSDCGQ